jgi:hypothetical protein
MHPSLLLLAFVPAATACSAFKDASPEGAGSPVGRSVPVDSAIGVAASGSAAAPAPAVPDSVSRPRAPLVPTPAAVRGLYVNRWASLGRKQWELIDVAKRTEVNALVLDVKDDRGLML